MRPIRKAAALQRAVSRTGGFVGLLCIMCAAQARADMLLLSNTTLVSGSQSAVFSFNAPSAGTVSAQLTDVTWPQSLSALSFVAATANQVLSSWSATSLQPGPTSQTLYFQVAGPGSYFADVMATAGGPLNLGVFSLSLDFKPANSPVPIPPSGWLLLSAVLLMVGLRSSGVPARIALAHTA